MKWWQRINPYAEYNYDNIDPEFHLKDGTPKKCFKCGNDFFRNNNLSMIGSTICEMELTCGNCKEVVGYWGFGAWHPGYLIKKFNYGRLFKDTWKRVVYEIKTLFRIRPVQENWTSYKKVERQRSRSNS